MKLFLDLETLPAQRPDVLEEIRESCRASLEADIAAIKPPANYGADAAAKWWQDKGNAQITALQASTETTVDAAYRKTGLDGAFGQICVIGWALDDEAPQALASADDEASVLRAFFLGLKTEIPPNELHATMIVGHNCANFDMRFLAQRSIVHGIRPHPVIARATRAKPWESEIVFDTMVQWAGVGGKISLDKLCRALSLPSPKGEITGANVWDYVKAGRIAEVADYCKRDVDAVRAVHRRMTFSSEPVRQPQFDDVPA